MLENTKLCDVCHTKPFKYVCPGCKTRTCSVECSKAHKAATGCTGTKPDPTFIPLSEMNDDTILDDYRFLMKKIELVQESRFTRTRLKRPAFVDACQKNKELKEQFKQFRTDPNQDQNPDNRPRNLSLLDRKPPVPKHPANQKPSRMTQLRSVLTDIDSIESELPDQPLALPGMAVLPSGSFSSHKHPSQGQSRSLTHPPTRGRGAPKDNH